MKDHNLIEAQNKIKRKDPLDEMMNDIIRWEYKNRMAKKSLVEILREKYIIKRKNNKQI